VVTIRNRPSSRAGGIRRCAVLMRDDVVAELVATHRALLSAGFSVQDKLAVNHMTIECGFRLTLYGRRARVIAREVLQRVAAVP
jgi:hypothetical protein